jgi:hypothetical protein
MHPNVVIAIILILTIVLIALSVWAFIAYANLKMNRYLAWRVKMGLKVKSEVEAAAAA